MRYTRAKPIEYGMRYIGVFTFQWVPWSGIAIEHADWHWDHQKGKFSHHTFFSQAQARNCFFIVTRLLVGIAFLCAWHICSSTFGVLSTLASLSYAFFGVACAWWLKKTGYTYLALPFNVAFALCSTCVFDWWTATSVGLTLSTAIRVFCSSLSNWALYFAKYLPYDFLFHHGVSEFVHTVLFLCLDHWLCCVVFIVHVCVGGRLVCLFVCLFFCLCLFLASLLVPISPSFFPIT